MAAKPNELRPAAAAKTAGKTRLKIKSKTVPKIKENTNVKKAAKKTVKKAAKKIVKPAAKAPIKKAAKKVVKKAAAKKPAAKKTAAKKAVAKKVVAKKVVTKAAPKKVAKKAAVKNVAKKVVKKVARKTAVKKVVAKKPAPKVTVEIKVTPVAPTAPAPVAPAAPVKPAAPAPKPVAPPAAPPISLKGLRGVSGAKAARIAQIVAESFLPKAAEPAPEAQSTPAVAVSHTAGTDTRVASAEASGEALTAAHKAAAVLFSKKAEDVVLMDLRNLSTVADYYLIATCTNEPQMRSIIGTVQRALSRDGIKSLRSEYMSGARWAVIDYGDLIVHLFEKQTRGYYSLERLWADAPSTTLKAEDYALPEEADTDADEDGDL